MLAERVADIEALFAVAREGDEQSFGDWMGRVERPIHDSLKRFARVVDLEVVMQETFARMWVLARDPSRPLEGPNASLRFAIRVARNVALEEIRRARLGWMTSFVDLDVPPEPAVFDDPPADPGLARIIESCIEALPKRPREAILARIRMGGIAPDRALAEMMRMTVNTFLQNIVRARALLARCFEKHGVALEEHLS
jgi:RNA polymerase sigma-70 factor (ECF subfamily)